jgi:hypothetical protein
MLHDKWLTARLAYLRGLKAPSDQQRLLLVLADKLGRTDADAHVLTALIGAEAAAERAQKAREQATRIVEADKEALRILEADKEALRILEVDKEAALSARDRELYKTAELLILAGLVDSATGSPAFDRRELLGALLELAKVPIKDARRSEWKSAGEALLAEKAK